MLAVPHATAQVGEASRLLPTHVAMKWLSYCMVDCRLDHHRGQGCRVAGAAHGRRHDTSIQCMGPHRLSPCHTARPPSSPHTKSAMLGCIDLALSQPLLQAQVLCVVAAWTQVAGLMAASKPAGASRDREHWKQAAWSQQGLRCAAGGQCTAVELAPGLGGSAARQMDGGNRGC